jgi:hypothetical protein
MFVSGGVPYGGCEAGGELLNPTGRVIRGDLISEAQGPLRRH